MKPCILIDTREKKPLVFKGVTTEIRTLKMGDYSIKGCYCKGGIVIERKSPQDLIASLTQRDNLQRLRKELNGLTGFAFKGIIIETTPTGLLSPFLYRRTTANPHAVMRFFIKVCLEYGVSPLFGGDVHGTALLVQTLLTEFQKSRW